MRDTKRILIERDGKNYLLFTAALDTDKYSQRYIKITFPFFLNGTLHESKVPSNKKSYEFVQDKSNSKQIHDPVSEYSYHLDSGIVTIKGKQKYSDKIFGIPLFNDVKIISLLRLTIGNFNRLEEYKKTLKHESHAVLPVRFESGQYVFNLALAKVESLNIVNLDEINLQTVQYLSIKLANDVYVILSIYKNIHPKNGMDFSFFMYDDPLIVSKKPKNTP